MISNQVLQNTIDGLKNISRYDLNVIDREGKIAAATERGHTGLSEEEAESFVNSPAESQTVQGYQYFKVFDNNVAEYIIGVKGEDDEASGFGRVTAFHIQNLLTAYKERYDKDNFIKNLLLDNLLLVDIYNRAKKLHIETAVRRVVYLIDTEIDWELNSVEVIRNIFPNKSRDFITALNERSIVLVKELKDKDSREEIEKIARTIYDTITAEAMSKLYISIGMPFSDIKTTSGSYKEAKMALDVGKIFEPEKVIINYDKLGIGRLIYHLPPNLCKMFVAEVLHNIALDSLDDETVITINKFFECSLNVSETSRQLYIHRNTLVYRLDKLQKQTGLDLRNFEDAIVLKMTIMVNRYMNHGKSTS